MKPGVTIIGTSFGAQTEDDVQMHPPALSVELQIQMRSAISQRIELPHENHR